MLHFLRQFGEWGVKCIDIAKWGVGSEMYRKVGNMEQKGQRVRIWVYKYLWVGCSGFWYLPTVVTLQNKSCVQKLSKMIRSLQYHFNITSIKFVIDLTMMCVPHPQSLYPHSITTNFEVSKSICIIICILIHLFVSHLPILHSNQFSPFLRFLKVKKSDFQ